MTDEKLKERAREWVNEKYPDGDFAQYTDPIQDLINDMAAFASSIQEEAGRQLERVMRAIREVIPESEHPAEPTIDNWLWQLRTLGDDRRAAYAQRTRSEKQLAEARSQGMREAAQIARGLERILGSFAVTVAAAIERAAEAKER